MALDSKYEVKHKSLLRDARPLGVRIADWLEHPTNSFSVFFIMGISIHFNSTMMEWADLVVVSGLLYYIWLRGRDKSLPFKLPLGSKHKDKKSRSGEAEGILFLGNTDPKREEVWFSNSDARTHVLYLGTTGSGKTVGLRGMATNALAWGSGFVYIDGKADTDLWSALSSLVRRFGRDDDLLVLNYMTGNSDRKAPSNTMNPFSSGSASYLTQMLVSLMPDAEGDNAMWKERAVSLIGSLLPVLTWRRDFLDLPMSVGTIRQNLTLGSIVKLSRDESIPDHLRQGLKGYLETLPGYVDAAFDDEGRDKPMGPDQPMIDTTTAKTQHGYLSMQFTRSLQSLADDYGYIFDAQAADVDMLDVVLNRRILIVLIPALEKSADEAANLGKIVSATIKGMMGASLGATVEGDSATVIENKPTNSATPFMTIFDEVGYYAAQGMAVMAAQARSLGFSMIFSAQDLPALEKRVKEEARSIAANCNIKIFGKLEDPTQTKEFFEKTVGSSFVTEVSGFATEAGSLSHSYSDNMQASVQTRGRANYDAVRGFKEGQAVIAFGDAVVDVKFFFSDPGHAKAMRVTRYVALPPTDETAMKHMSAITKLRDKMVKKGWTALKSEVNLPTSAEIAALCNALDLAENVQAPMIDSGTFGLVSVYSLAHNLDEIEEAKPVARPAQSSGAQSSGNPMGAFTTKPNQEDGAANATNEDNDDGDDIPTGTSWMDFVEKAEAAVDLDEDTKHVLEDAARKARESIFRSTDDEQGS
ncbi:MAG: TraM recognition domain-containing protein [Pseudobdellovibrionaceae bacterium]|jgi:intracellular multiplication protein IcmO|nr:TraM recognition domain-containing protein [Pseudobdellovibrionaceae bacterium]